ncbi:hypothetical protein AVEN_259268-1 [Araneus ventricosus]|uniref:Uncharacterized protein n=1 Tax=Araneus ventricosus TaxID=182803 RepID=A0A4Y2RPY0_ARAVE|nr:hypothetical protein AVEN_259268-1 [Araneus ventricosus]
MLQDSFTKGKPNTSTLPVFIHSIIYASNGKNDPEIGDFLGDFTDELERDVIVKFVSGGAKNYAYVTKSGKSVCKIRGFSNYENDLKLNFDSVLKLVRPFDDERITVTNPRKITRSVKAGICYCDACPPPTADIDLGPGVRSQGRSSYVHPHLTSYY